MGINIISNLPMPRDWKEDLDTKLNQPTINDEYSNWKVEKSFGKEIDMFALSFSTSAIGNIKVFNDINDKDKLGNYPGSPFTTIGDGKVMVRYDLSAKLKAGLGFDADNIGFDVDTEHKIMTSYYTVHDSEKTLGEATTADLTNFKFIFSRDNVSSLKPNEGLSLQYLGSITANLELSFSDAYTGTISALSSFLPEGAGISAEVKAGASVNFKLKIDDEFKAFIRKKDDGKFHVSINKAASSTKSVMAKVGVEAQLVDDDNFRAFQNLLLDSLLSEHVETVDDIIENKLGNLSNKHKEIIESVIKRLGWEADLSEPDQIKAHYSKLKTDVIEKATGFLTQKLELGFSFEYQRIDTRNTLFEATAPQTAIETGLRDIIMFRPAAFSEVDGVEVTKFLLKKTKSMTSKIGFALKFGDFKLAWQHLKSYKEETIEDNVANTKDISLCFLREHHYSGANNRKWAISMNAEMDEPTATPRMSDFKFDLTLHWEDRQKKTDADELNEFVNMATIWKCVAENKFDEIREEIKAATLGQDDVKYSCHLNVPSGVLNGLFRGIASANNVLIADSLAEAMPYANYAYRKSPSLRKTAYNSIWQHYLKKEPVDNETRAFANICGRYLPQDPSLALWEAQYKSGSMTRDNGAISFVGLIEFFSAYQIIRNVKTGTGNLDMLIKNNESYIFSEVKSNFDLIDNIFKFKGANDVYFHLNLLSRLILNVSAELDIQGSIETNATVDYKEGKTNKRLVFTL